jgi:hypothetical protein
VEGRSGDGLENPAATEETIITYRRRRERSHGRDYTAPTSALGQKQTSDRRLLMSALPPKADIAQRDRHVRFVPEADMSPAARACAEAVIRSVELIVQPDAKDAVGEMRVRGDLPYGQPDSFRIGPNNKTGSAARTCGVQRAKVKVKALYFPSPTWQTC